MSTKKLLMLLVVLILIVGAIFYLESRKASSSGATAPVEKLNLLGKEEKASKYKPAIEISTPDGFINTGLNPDGSPKKITLGELVGKKVILLDIWTYSCINCQRTIPYLNSWYEKYKDDGLEIIGLHTPEFDFEKKYENVLEAVQKFGIKFPVVLDNDYSTWNAYGNRYWPRKYLIDIDGFIVYDHIGEGSYEETEMKIQELLAERKAVLGEGSLIKKDLTVGENLPTGVRSPETYFGSSRNEYLGSSAPLQIGIVDSPMPEIARPDTLYLVGKWNITPERAESVGNSGSKIVYKYTAKKVFFVATSNLGVYAKVLIDGKPISDNLSGEDVKGGQVLIKEPRLYKIVNDKSSSQHTLELDVSGAGLQAFTFTFE